MIRDSLRRRVSTLERDRQERDEIAAAAAEQGLALAGRYVEKAQRALDDGRPVPRETLTISSAVALATIYHGGPVRTPEAVEAAAWQTLKAIADLEVPDLATGEDLRQYLDRLIEQFDLAAIVEP
ncbi:hypothetical protein [Methanoculleus sp.]|jgi:hypothetical protein|uniref:hypothetical protein n=1 Tax=Methanoculleus sp. TaxID=90427 RepID=UPI001BD5D9E0|nr:hypothetical protein [Methanoculleus sp.]